MAHTVCMQETVRTFTQNIILTVMRIVSNSL